MSELFYDRFFDGTFNHIIPLTFILIAMILGLLIFSIRYAIYRYKKKKYS